MGDSDQDVAAGFLARLETFRRSDRERDEMVQELINKYNKMEERYRNMADQHDTERETRLMWQKQSKSHEQELSQLKLANESNSFVYAVIDGDGAYFRDELMAQGEDGGAQAAHLLGAEIKHHLKQQYPGANVDDWRIIVQVVLGVEGLNKKLRSCGILKDPRSTVATFGVGFGLSQPLFSFVDVGYGKERADHKIIEMIRAMMRLSQCRHLFFGPCNDNGYLNFLEEYKRDDAVARKLTLIETQIPQPGFVKLGFPRVTFPTVFRSGPLPDNPTWSVGNGAAASGAPVSFAAASGAPVSFSTSAPDANGGTKRPSIPEAGSPLPSSRSLDYIPLDHTPTVANTSKRRFYLLNAQDQRVDDELPEPSLAGRSGYEARRKLLGGKNYCNHYHLNGYCSNGDYCRHEHGEFLSEEEQIPLWHKARGNPCNLLHDCRKFDCVNGHNCRFISNNSCYMGFRCKFAETHQMDLTPVIKVYEDGKRERLA